MSNSDLAAFKAQPKGFATKAIHVGQDPEQWNSMAVIAPIVTSTTFKQEAPGKHKVYNTNCYEERQLYLVRPARVPRPIPMAAFSCRLVL